MVEEAKSRKLRVQVQKKILTKMASKQLSALLIDEKTSEMLDDLHKILKEHFKCRKRADRTRKHLMKIMIKIGVLHKNQQFDAEEIDVARRLQKKTRRAALTVVSFREVEHSHDVTYLGELLREMRECLLKLAERHLKGKTKSRIDEVFDVLGDATFLGELFREDGRYRDRFGGIYLNIKSLIDGGSI